MSPCAKVCTLSRGWRECYFETVGSTMDVARSLAKSNEFDEGLENGGIVVRASRQTGGRGRLQRPWISDNGNLYLSVILKEKGPLSILSALSFVAVVALGEVIGERLDRSSAIAFKWPNDLLINGTKCGGILLEVCSESLGKDGGYQVIIGVGVNLVSHPDGLAYPATNLQAHGVHISPAELCAIYVSSLDIWRQRWHKHGFAPIHAAWVVAAKGMGKPIMVQINDEKISGIFEEFSKDGQLVLRLENGSHRYISAGDIFFHDGLPLD